MVQQLCLGRIERLVWPKLRQLGERKKQFQVSPVARLSGESLFRLVVVAGVVVVANTAVVVVVARCESVGWS